MRVTMMLRHVLYMSYLVPESRVRPRVPDVLPLSPVGGDKILVSVVIMRCTDVTLRPFLWPRLAYNQVNLRTYVKDPVSGERSVYFFSTGVTSSAVSLMTHMAGIPWERMELDLQSSEEGSHCPGYAASGRLEGEVLVLADTAPSSRTVTWPFPDARSETEYVLRPSIGFYKHASGRVVRLVTRHPPVEPGAASVSGVRFALLTRMGMVTEAEIETPQSALFVPREQFIAFVPLRPL
ncbi:MAG: DUF2071 domain-containing protein [Chloroflexi bacterium]|nr:DUF2071 domain-containing protein [Chloroflexota bacterium]